MGKLRTNPIRSSYVGALLFVSSIVSPAYADVGAECAEERYAHQHLRIAACDRLLASLTLTNRERALVYAYRARARQRSGVVDHLNIAFSDYSTSIQIEPSSEAFRGRAQVLVGLGKLAEALADAEALVKMQPTTPGPYFLKAEILAQAGQPDRAIDTYTKAVNLMPKNIEPLNRRAKAYADLGQFEKAVADYTSVIGLAPRDKRGYWNRGHLYRRVGRLDEAIADFTQIINLQTGQNEGYYARAHAYEAAGKLQLAKADFDTVIERSPAILSRPYIMRGRFFQRLRRHKQAVENYTLAITGSPHEFELFLRRGLSHEALGNCEHAKADFAYASKSEFYEQEAEAGLKRIQCE